MADGVASPVTIPGAKQFDVTSKASGREYRVFVSRPLAPPPDGGYPVLVVTDGNMTFPIATMMSNLFAFGGEVALIVGVGYADPAQAMQRRFKDLTPPTPLSGIRQMPGRPPLAEADVGGAREFQRFLTEELRPRIAADWPTDAADWNLFGYSLGGLFVLDALIERPDAYRSFIASSPSIWWNSCAVLGGEARFARRVEAREVEPRVLVTIGSAESDPPAKLPPGMDAAQMQALGAEARMVANARELGERLGQIEGGPGYVARFHAFEGDDHTMSVSAAISRALAFALRA
jgi:predicted alpha/beta superfamily hydrolase